MAGCLAPLSSWITRPRVPTFCMIARRYWQWSHGAYTRALVKRACNQGRPTRRSAALAHL